MAKQRSLVNCAHHQMCVIDVETTSIDIDKAEIWQLGIVPLDRRLNIIPDAHLCIDIQPLYSPPPNRRAAAGMMPEAAVERFVEWFENLQLLDYKKIVPVGHNYARYDSILLERWLGPITYSHYFHHRIRDTMLFISSLMDFFDYQVRDNPFGKSVKLGAACEAMGIEVNPESQHDALYDATITAQLYKKLMDLGGTIL